MAEAYVLACRYCGGQLLADGEGGWSCPTRDQHGRSSADVEGWRLYGGAWEWPRIEALIEALIADRADLLAALKSLLSDIEDYQRINSLGGRDNHSQRMARAAIAKADGK